MEDFVSFELANKLKEKGFPQVKKGTLAMYDERCKWYSLVPTNDEEFYSFNAFDDRDYVCPTISQVLKWLREDKNLFIEIAMAFNNYYFEIYNTNQYDETYGTQLNRKFNEKSYSSYEQAALAGIEYVLNNLI